MARRSTPAPGVRVTFLDAGHIPGSASICSRWPCPARRGGSCSPATWATGCRRCWPRRGRRPRPTPCSSKPPTGRSAARRRSRSSGPVPPSRWPRRSAKGALLDSLFRPGSNAEDSLRAAPCPAGEAAARAAADLLSFADGQGDHGPVPEASAAAGFRRRLPPTADAFSPAEVRSTVPSAKRLPRPCIIISTGDIMVAQWMRRLLSTLLPEPTTNLFLVGYQARGSAGELLLHGAQRTRHRRTYDSRPSEGAVVLLLLRPCRRQSGRCLAGQCVQASHGRAGAWRQGGIGRACRTASGPRLAAGSCGPTRGKHRLGAVRHARLSDCGSRAIPVRVWPACRGRWRASCPVRRRRPSCCRRRCAGPLAAIASRHGRWRPESRRRAAAGWDRARRSRRPGVGGDVAAADQIGPLQRVVQFADVARPIVARQQVDGIGVDLAGALGRRCAAAGVRPAGARPPAVRRSGGMLIRSTSSR